MPAPGISIQVSSHHLLPPKAYGYAVTNSLVGFIRIKLGWAIKILKINLNISQRFPRNP
jgi:hypothetical protein